MNVGLPYSSSREPVMGRNVVATSQPLAAQAGLMMLHAIIAIAAGVSSETRERQPDAPLHSRAAQLGCAA